MSITRAEAERICEGADEIEILCNRSMSRRGHFLCTDIDGVRINCTAVKDTYDAIFWRDNSQPNVVRLYDDIISIIFIFFFICNIIIVSFLRLFND